MDELPGGPLLAERLDKAVREVCPIHGVSIGRRVDETGAWARDTWRVNPKAEATLDEIRAAFDVLASFDPDAQVTPAPAPEPHNFPENMSDKLSDWDTEASLTTVDLTEEVIQRLTAAKRKKFTELLNVELAELQQERGGPRESLSREAEIEKLLGLFARVGEM